MASGKLHTKFYMSEIQFMANYGLDEDEGDLIFPSRDCRARHLRKAIKVVTEHNDYRQRTVDRLFMCYFKHLIDTLDSKALERDLLRHQSDIYTGLFSYRVGCYLDAHHDGFGDILVANKEIGVFGAKQLCDHLKRKLEPVRISVESATLDAMIGTRLTEHEKLKEREISARQQWQYMRKVFHALNTRADGRRHLVVLEREIATYNKRCSFLLEWMCWDNDRLVNIAEEPLRQDHTTEFTFDYDWEH